MHLPFEPENYIPDENEFIHERQIWRNDMANDASLREKAISLTLSANKFNYGYQWEWCGIPIIRHPDDIVLQQELIWNLRPSHIIETGIARGGSLVLSATLMEMSGKPANVLGIDLQIFPHAYRALDAWLKSGKVKILESDSASLISLEFVRNFLGNVKTPVLLVLDSNHTHDHVLKELNIYSPLLPKESIIIVADTIINEMPRDYYQNRHWSHNRNPMTAIQEFLKTNSNYAIDKHWARRSLTSEFRDGILRRIN